MLSSLNIKNLALFENQEIEFGRGLNIILGETGAGKSLIFDALFFVMSLKTDKSLISSGAESMRVDATFSPISKQVQDILKELELDFDELIVSRIMHADGRTSTKINGSPCTQSVIKRISAEIIDSLMQHESMEMLKNKNHIIFLDKFSDVEDLKSSLSKLLEQKKILKKQIESLGGSDEQRARRLDILDFQINEIENADLKIGEDDELENKIQLLENSERISESLSEVLSVMDGSGGVIKSLALSERMLSKLADIEELGELSSRLTSARIEIDDIVSEVSDFLSNVGGDPKELERLQERKDKIRSLKRKFGGSIEAVLNSLEEFQAEKDALIEGEERLDKINKQIELLDEQMQKIADEIHKKRIEGAEKIKRGLEGELKELGMKDARVEVGFESKSVSADGADEVKLLFSANKGQDLKELVKTASGGESSRLMLAMKNMFARVGDERTLLFDEIDSGISGEVGNMMARKLQSISHRDQVLAITHLPQVAASGDKFIKVEKFNLQNKTLSKVTEVNGEAAVEEIAHIIGGKNLTDAMLQNARELLQRARINSDK